MGKLNIYAVSDSVGETAEQLARAVMRQFDVAEYSVKRFSFINDKESIDNIIERAKEEEAFIVYTLVVEELRDYMEDQADRNDIGSVDILTPVLLSLVEELGLPPKYEPGLLRKLDERYYKRVEAVEFAVKYDDGKDTRGILLADIVLIGVSRTSKTPLSMYLAHKNVKVANIPLVPEVSPPEELKQIPSKKIIGLTLNIESLNRIRKERLKAMGLKDSANYANLERIYEELTYADDIMKKLNCMVIDTTNKAVEETATTILEYIQENKK